MAFGAGMTAPFPRGGGTDRQGQGRRSSPSTSTARRRDQRLQPDGDATALPELLPLPILMSFGAPLHRRSMIARRRWRAGPRRGRTVRPIVVRSIREGYRRCVGIRARAGDGRTGEHRPALDRRADGHDRGTAEQLQLKVGGQAASAFCCRPAWAPPAREPGAGDLEQGGGEPELHRPRRVRLGDHRSGWAAYDRGATALFLERPGSSCPKVEILEVRRLAGISKRAKVFPRCSRTGLRRRHRLEQSRRAATARVDDPVAILYSQRQRHRQAKRRPPHFNIESDVDTLIEQVFHHAPGRDRILDILRDVPLVRLPGSLALRLEEPGIDHPCPNPLEAAAIGDLTQHAATICWRRLRSSPLPPALLARGSARCGW